MTTTVGDFAEQLVELGIKDVKVPKGLKIPNWPSAAGNIKITLRYPRYLLPDQKGERGTLRLKRRRGKLWFYIFQDGTFAFYRPIVFGLESSSLGNTGDHDNLDRLRALALFHQCRDRIIPKVLQKLRKRLPAHNETMELADQALEPFKPFLVADELSN